MSFQQLCESSGSCMPLRSMVQWTVLLRPAPLLPQSAEHQELTVILYDYNDWAPNEELGRASLALRELPAGREQPLTLKLRATGGWVGVGGGGGGGRGVEGGRGWAGRIDALGGPPGSRRRVEFTAETV